MLGKRIKQARKAAGLNMRDLAKQTGVSAMAISKYERGQTTPSSKVLLGLSKALGLRVEYFFRQTTVQLKDPDFRKHPKLPEKTKQKVIADAQEQLERWLELEELIPGRWAAEFHVPAAVPTKIATYDVIEDVAQAVRGAWKLGTNPIPDLLGTLEAHGIKVLLSEFANAGEFDGLAAMTAGQPVVVVGTNLPGDRQRLTLAHELGHLILKDRLPKTLKEETACHRFAGAFLVPKDKVLQSLGKGRTWLEPRELWILKQEYGLSMGGWTYRARDLGIITQNTMSELWRLFRKNGWDKKEPDPQYPSEIPRRFQQLVYRALAEDMLSESKAAELLGISLMTLKARRNMDRLNDAANQ